MNGWMITYKTDLSIVLINIITTSMIEFCADGNVRNGLLGQEAHTIAGPMAEINKTYNDVLVALGLPIHIQNEILEFMQK
jgi:hypothetical protein